MYQEKIVKLTTTKHTETTMNKEIIPHLTLVMMLTWIACYNGWATNFRHIRRVKFYENVWAL